MIAESRRPAKSFAPVSSHSQPQQMQPQIASTPPQTASAQPQARQFTITIPAITVVVGKEFKSKLPFLALIFLLFSFSLVMFERSNFNTLDLVDFQRFEYHMQKIYSLSFIIFILLFSASLGIAIFFGARISRLLSLVVLPITLISAFGLGIVYPPLLTPFLAFAFTVSAAALISSFYREPSFSTAWGTASKALLVLLVLSFFIVFGKVAATKDAHIDALFVNLAAIIPGGGDMQATIQSLPITKQTVADAVGGDNLKQVLSKQDAEDALSAATGLPVALSDSQYQALITQLQTSIADHGDVIASSVKSSLATQFSSSGSSGSAELLKMQVLNTPAFKPFYDNFALMVAFIGVSIVSLMSVFIQILASAAAYGLSKL